MGLHAYGIVKIGVANIANHKKYPIKSIYLKVL